MKIEDVGAWLAFQGVARHGNFSKAAQALKLAVPQVSKRVARLEEGLGVRLFRRSTRVVQLTDEGKALLPKVEALLEEWKGAESFFDESGELSGTLRLASIPFVAHRLLVPLIAEFTRAHPRVRFELDLSESVLNLAEAGIDLAVRIDEPGDTSLIYRKLASNDLVLCATPRYLKESGEPLSELAHLKRHRLLMLEIHGDRKFTRSGKRLAEFSDRRAIACENGWFLTELALAHQGVLVRSIWDVREHLAAGRLVRVLPKQPLESFGHIYAVVPERKLMSARVRSFLDLLVERAKKWALSP